MMKNIGTFQNCCTSQAVTDKNLELGRAAE